ncbi:MAG: hypothetical protein ACOY9D_12955 [Pseudomonadota bacterium]
MKQPIKNISDEDVTALAQAVEKLHNAKAVFVRSYQVHEQFKDETVWKGTVSFFELIEHPSASYCYAWSDTNNSKQKFYAVLQTRQVDSPEKAVRASIISDQRKPGTQV